MLPEIVAALAGLGSLAGHQDAAEAAPVNCPAILRYDVNFRSAAAADRLIVRAGGEDCRELSIEISDGTGARLLHFEPETECSRTPAAYRRFAETLYVPGREQYEGGASGLPVGDDMPPLRYMYVEDYDLYYRAVETGGPLVCFRSYDFGSACAWYDPEAEAGVILFERGS
jgi:hypothetical protein